MKNKFLRAIVILAFTFAFNNAFSQLPAGSYAPAFSMVDIQGNTQVLYNYTNAGKPVILDISAVWCGPCWAYFQTGALETAYNTWGPPGTNELMVLWIEGDQNPLPCLEGNGCGTQGDWTAGTPFPQMLTVAPNSYSVVSAYGITYFPTIYVICPNRILSEVGQQNAAGLHAACQACAPLPTTTNDVKIYSIAAPLTSTCGNGVSNMVSIQNIGSATLTSLKLTAKVDGVVKGIKNWTGSLGRFEKTSVVMPVISGLSDGAHTYTIVTSLPNGVADEDTTNDAMTTHFGFYSTGGSVQVKVTTDAYPAEVSWKIFEQGTSNIVMEKSNLVSGANSSTICLGYGCYTFTIYDANGNGMSSPGVATVYYSGNELVNIPGTSYTSSASADFCITSSGIGEEAAVSAMSVFPNPFAGEAQIKVDLSEPQDVILDVYNMRGDCVYHMAQGALAAGEHSFTLKGDQLSIGLYVVRMKVGTETMTKRIELVR